MSFANRDVDEIIPERHLEYLARIATYAERAAEAMADESESTLNHKGGREPDHNLRALVQNLMERYQELLSLRPRHTVNPDIEETLHRVLNEHPAGPLALKSSQVRRCADGFDFLGYRVYSYRGEPFTEPTKKNCQALYNKILMALCEEVKELDATPINIRHMASGWVQGFPHSIGAGVFADQLIQNSIDFE